MKGKVIGTCGHEISPKWLNSGKGKICIKDYDKGERCISYLVVCSKCLKWYQKEGLVMEPVKVGEKNKPQDTALYASLRR